MTQQSASERYELAEAVPDPGRRGWGRLRQVLGVVAGLGLIPAGGRRLLILDRGSGRVVGEVRQTWGSDSFDMRVRFDIRTLSADDFAARWLG